MERPPSSSAVRHPRALLVQLARQYLLFLNHRRYSDALGLWHPRVMGNGMSGVDLRVQTSLVWARHPGLQVIGPACDGEIEVLGGGVVELNVVRQWDSPAGKVSHPGRLSLTFSEDSLLVSFTDKHADGSLCWARTDLSDYEGQARLNHVMGEEELDKWIAGSEWGSPTALSRLSTVTRPDSGTHAGDVAGEKASATDVEGGTGLGGGGGSTASGFAASFASGWDVTHEAESDGGVVDEGSRL